jgi:hypothetical protein
LTFVVLACEGLPPTFRHAFRHGHHPATNRITASATSLYIEFPPSAQSNTAASPRTLLEAKGST